MKSIRAFLLWRVLAGTTLVLLATGFAVYFLVARSLESEFDRDLAARVQALASILFQVEDRVDFEFSEQLMPEYAEQERPCYFELRREDGALLERSVSLGEHDLVLPQQAQHSSSVWSAPLPDGRDGRYVSRQIEVHHVYPEEGQGRPAPARIDVVVATGRESLVAAEREVLVSCVLGALIVIVLMGLVSRHAIDLGLEPARRLAAKLDSIDVRALPDTLSAGEMPSELQPVVEKADALIRRVDEALHRERRTVADIAHELRTPICEILTTSEVALRAGSDRLTGRKAMTTVRDIAWRMGTSVSTLLQLARLEMDAETFESEEVDMSALVREIAHSLVGLRLERAMHLDNQVAPGARVRADRAALRLVVSNLCDNALYYAPPATTATLRLETVEPGWRFVVENEVVDLQPEDLPVLTEPFWRKDHARTDRSRSGLGLALSTALAARMNMELSFQLRDHVFRAVLASTEPRPAGG